MDNEDKYRKELEKNVIEVIEECLEQTVELNTCLRDICNNLDMMEIFMAVEEEFEVEISPADEEMLETPADFVRFIMENE